MVLELIVWLLLALAFAAYATHLLRVVRDDDRGHTFTHRAAPSSHEQDSTAWPPRAA